MRTCDYYQEQLTAFLDRELESAMVAQVESHLRGCAPCRQALAVQKRERLWLENHRAELEPSVGLWQRIERDIDSVAAQRRNPWSRLADWLLPVLDGGYRKAWVGAALVVVCAISFLFVLQSGGTAPSDVAVRRDMEQYIEWRQSQQPLWIPTPAASSSDINELRSSNPFVTEKQSVKKEANPFEI